MNRQHLARRLLLDLIGAGLLLISSLWLWWSPDQAPIAYLLQAVAALIVAAGVVIRGLRDAFSTQPKQYADQLLSIAVLAACAYGDFVTATLVPLALDSGRLFEERTALGVNNAIRQIRSLQVDQVLLLDDAERRLIPVEQLAVGQQICIRAGERIPVDGVVVQGRSSVDQAVMTGESHPVSVDAGSEVFAGTTNLQGEIIVEATQVGEASALGRIIQLMESAQQRKTPIVERIESWLGVYLPITLALSATVLFFTEDIDRAIAVLIVSFPSSLAIAGSATMIAAFSKAASLSIFIKDGETFQRLREAGTIVFDKTGTLTVGIQGVTSVETVEDVSVDTLHWAALQCANHSNHPVSQAIVRDLHTTLDVVPPVESREVPGCGVESNLEQCTLRLGRLTWLQSCGVDIPSETMATGTWVSKDQQLLGVIRLSDQIRSDAMAVKERLVSMGVSTQVMMTGDFDTEAKRVGQELAFVEIVSEALPEEKWRNIQSLRTAGHVVCMVGDGINDALALQEADVGIAIGTSLNHAAMSGADIALMSDKLERVVDVFQLAERVHLKIIQNVVLGFGFSLGMFVVVTTGQLTALQAAVIHNVGALCVIVNSSLLWRQRP